MKTKTKILTVLMIVLFAVLLLGTTKVNAVEVTDENVEETGKFCMFSIQNIDGTNLDNMGQGDEISQELACEVKNITKDGYYFKLNTGINLGKSITLKGLGDFTLARTYNDDKNTYYEYKTAAKKVNEIDKKVEEFEFDLKDINTNKVQHFKLKLSFIGEIKKEDTTTRAKLDEILKELEIKYPKNEEGEYVVFETPELGKEDDYSYEDSLAKVTNTIKEQGYTLVDVGGYGGGGDLIFLIIGGHRYDIFKDDIYYETIDIQVKSQTKLTIPSTVQDIETYITNKLKESSDFKEIKKVEKTDGNYYIVYGTDDYGTDFEAQLLVKKETSSTITKEDVETGIKLNTSVTWFTNDMVFSVKRVTSNIEVAENVVKYMAYNIDLLKNGNKIQPNGKVKVSIPIPSGYDKSRLEIYRIEENGEKIKYDVKVEGNYATFETDHFSIYVLAETTNNTTNKTETPKKELDETPKTGTIEMIYYILPVAVISVLGIIAFKKKEN